MHRLHPAETTMTGSLSLLAELPRLRPLLTRYRDLRERDAEPTWHDRVGSADNAADELHRLYGVLLAEGWLDARVGADTLAVPGELRGAYRITREGLQALRRTDEHFGIAFVAAADDD